MAAAGGVRSRIAVDRDAGRGGAIDDGAADVVGGDDPVGGVPRAGVFDNDVAGGVHIDAAVGAGAVVALDAVVGAADSGVDARGGMSRPAAAFASG